MLTTPDTDKNDTFGYPSSDDPIVETHNIDSELTQTPRISTADGLYEQYRDDLNQKNVSEIVGSLKPTIDYTLNSLGAGNDNLIRTKAKTVTARAIKKYDPEHGTSLPTYVSSQLKQLTRDVRQQRNPLNIPERKLIEAAQLHRAEQEFFDIHDREPDVLELAEATGIPVKKIHKIRAATSTNAVTEGQFFAGAEDGDVGEFAGETPDYLGEALEYVYVDSDYRDRKILEHTSGYGGATILTPGEIALKLNISESQVSRRLARLALKIQELEEGLNK